MAWHKMRPLLGAVARRSPAALAPVAGRARKMGATVVLVVVPVVLVVVAFVGLLTYQTYIDADFHPDDDAGVPGSASNVPDDIEFGGPLIDTTNGQAVSYELPPKTIVLTFDDGPDPEWTPEVLAVLAKYGVKGTFFEIGSSVARHPELARQVVAQGNEVGVHTFTHANMANVSDFMRQMEYSQTQLVLAGATGVTTPLLRFPYSAGADSLDNVTWPLVQEAGSLGYIVVTTELDSEDWQRPGVAEIVAGATPSSGASGVVLLHDAGGDRSQTVAALDVLIPALQGQGYQFLTVTQALAAAQQLALAQAEDPTATTPLASGALEHSPTMTAASASQLWRGRLLLWTIAASDGLFAALKWAVLGVGVLLIGRTLVMFVLATRHARRRRSASWSWGPVVTAPVSVVMPVYNEHENIAAAVRSIALGDYGAIEVIVVDDGSTDDTAAIVSGLGLPNVRLVSIPNGGKPNALNVGIAHASHDIIVMVDGDTVFEPDSLRLLVQPFADPSVGGVAGNVKVSNRGGMIGKWQHIEYVIGFNLDRRLYELLQCMPTIPGAIGGFRRQALADAGGVSDRTLAEDTDLTMAINRAGWRVVYEEKARAWTEAPASLSQLWRQRYRWSYGTMQAMWIHRGAIRETGPSGRFGRVGLPFLALFSIVFPLLAPVVDLMTAYGLIVDGSVIAALGWLGMLALQLLTAVVAFALDRERLTPLWALPLQQFVYRQLIYLILVRSLIAAVTGIRMRWQKLHRTGAAAQLLRESVEETV